MCVLCLRLSIVTNWKLIDIELLKLREKKHSLVGSVRDRTNEVVEGRADWFCASYDIHSMESVVRSSVQLLKRLTLKIPVMKERTKGYVSRRSPRYSFGWAARELSVSVDYYPNMLPLSPWRTPLPVSQFGYLACCHCFSHQNSKRHVGCKVVQAIACTEVPFEDSNGRLI
jgi:hypothetical protein